MVEFVLYNVNLDIIEVKELLEIVHLHVILVIFLIPQKDIHGRACSTACIEGFSDNNAASPTS